MIRALVHSRTVRRAGFAALLVATLILIGVSRYAVPLGLSVARPIPPLEQHYTAQTSGYLDIPAEGAHRLGIEFDGAARLVLDGRVIAEIPRGGQAFSRAPSDPGVHFVLVQFQPLQGGEVPVLYILTDHRWEMPVPRAALSPRRLPRAAWMLRRNLQWTTLTVGLTWMALTVALGLWWGRRWFARQLPPSPQQQRAAWALILFAVAMFAYPLWWGVPVGWSEDELLPVQRDEAAAMLERGWHSKYPPLHTWILVAMNAPLLIAAELDMLDPLSTPVYSAMKIMNNVVSVTMAVAIAALVYVCASRAKDHRVGVLAGVMWVVTLPAVYYAKTANLDIPYTFWFALSLVAYQAALGRGTVSTHVLFAGAATLSIVTKDQAYGLYALPALHLAVRRYRTVRSLGALLGDPAMLAAVATGGLLFAGAHNLPWNWQGFQAHVAVITGGASEGYRMVDSVSPAGQAWLLLRNIQQIGWSLSWPGAMLALAGLVWGLGSRAMRARLLPVILPAISYYGTFIAVVGYTYDRFLIPVCVVLAIFAGVALDRVWPETRSKWRTAAVAGLLVYMTLRTGSINLMMAADGRFEIQRWLRANLPPQGDVVVFESWSLLPNLKPFAARTLHFPLHDVPALRPEVIVLSDNYRRRFPADAPELPWHDALVSGRLGYRVALRHRGTVPLAILALEQQFRNPDPSFSVLHKVNPEILVLLRND